MITVNINKAKEIGHNIRREQRASEFEPLDAQIAKQIPGVDAQAVESQRQAVRDKYAAVRAQIDEAQSLDEIKAALGL